MNSFEHWDNLSHLSLVFLLCCRMYRCCSHFIDEKQTKQKNYINELSIGPKWEQRSSNVFTSSAIFYYWTVFFFIILFLPCSYTGFLFFFHFILFSIRSLNWLGSFTFCCLCLNVRILALVFGLNWEKLSGEVIELHKVLRVIRLCVFVKTKNWEEIPVLFQWVTSKTTLLCMYLCILCSPIFLPNFHSWPLNLVFFF